MALFDRRSIEPYLQNKGVDYLVDHALWLGVYQPAFGETISKNYELLFMHPSPAFKDILCLKRKVE